MPATMPFVWRPNAHVAHLSITVALFLSAALRSAGAQLPGSPAPPPAGSAPAPVIAPYRPPMLALVQPPASSAIVPQDRAIVVLRFTQGEAADPIDAASLRVTVDGTDRTSLFQVNGTDAWGPLSPTRLSIGAHQFAARICSSRGACGEASAALMVTGATTVPRTDVAAPAESRKARVFDLVLQAARRIMAP